MVDWHQRQKVPLKDFFAHLDPKEERHLYKKINEHDLLIVGKSVGGELIIVCSNVKNPNKVMKRYKQRWNIETCFRNMKKQGFELEKTHMTYRNRLNKLMAVVAVAMLITSCVGNNKKSPYKTTLKSPLYSIFTRGIRFIRNSLSPPEIMLTKACKMTK